MPGVLDGKAALVTGAGQGIGAAIARLFAGQGARVAVNDIRAANAERIGREVGGLPLVADVSVEDQVRAMFAACAREFGRLDILVNNAGIAGARLAAESMDIEAFDRTLAVNLGSALLCIKHAVPLLASPGGVVINVTSRGVSPNRSDYVASKFALRGLSECAAHELGPRGIRVVALCPGTVNTEMMRQSIAQWARRAGTSERAILETHYFAKSALRRLVEPEEVAAGALFLASPAASAVTAAELKVNGGRL